MSYMMEYWAVRQKSTGLLMPAYQRGITHYEFMELYKRDCMSSKEGAHGPRFFPSKLGAIQSMNSYVKGKWIRTFTEVGREDYFGIDVETEESLGPKEGTERDPNDFEIITVMLGIPGDIPKDHETIFGDLKFRING